MERNNVERTIHISVNSYILAPKNNDNEALAAAPLPTYKHSSP